MCLKYSFMHIQADDTHQRDMQLKTLNKKIISWAEFGGRIQYDSSTVGKFPDFTSEI